MVTKHAPAVSLESPFPRVEDSAERHHVVPIGTRQWRISNDADPSSPECRLAYVEAQGTGYDVLIVAPSPPEWLHVDTFDEAKRAAVRRPTLLL
ncbi:MULTISPECIES: hypothetical protein [unclassified Plantibacter]|uniref:hypothetical protein n=1 Tax=unclassified Plantibacter TaxID=2624265 RepID=UPI000A967370|nr:MULTISPECIES: hypothetical protein [unclassified Plantibacter]